MRVYQTVHPVAAFTYFMAVMSITMFISNPVILAISLLGALCFNMRRLRLQDAVFYALTFIIIALTNPLFSDSGANPLFFINGHAVTSEALLYGLNIAVMIVAVMLWSKAYSAVMTADKFFALFGRVIPKLTLILSIALRFIPQFKRQMKRVSDAQKAMGLYTNSKFKAAINVFYIMLSWSLENAADTGAAMRARGYGLKGRSHFKLYKLSAKDIFLIFITLLASVCVIALKATGSIDFFFYPSVSDIALSVTALTAYSAFFILAIMPFILETEETIKWNFCVSKI